MSRVHDSINFQIFHFSWKIVQQRSLQSHCLFQFSGRNIEYTTLHQWVWMFWKSLYFDIVFISLLFLYASACEMSWLRPPKQPTKSCFIKCLFLHTFLVGNRIFWESQSSTNCTDSTGLLHTEVSVLHVVFECVHAFSFSVRLCRTGSGIALKWKKYSSGHLQFKSNCWTLRAWSMWCK